jgi:hypothetical protein
MQPFSNESTSWGRFREQRSGHCIQPPAAIAAKLDDRWLWRRPHCEQRPEISIRGHDDSMPKGRTLQDRIVVGALQTLLSERGLHHDGAVAGERRAGERAL